MKTLLKFAAPILMIVVGAFAACRKNQVIIPSPLPLPTDPFKEYYFNDMGWDTTSDPMIMTMTLPQIKNDLSQTDIISITVNGNGAAYSTWEYPNPYYYEIINNRIVFFWTMQGPPFDSPDDRVDVIVKLRL